MTDIADFFASDPLELTDDNITTIIAEFRSRRAQFNLKAASPAKKAPASGKRLRDELNAELDL